MASTNKTPKLGLNQWAAGDEVLRTDFNGDNAKIEAAVGPLMATNPVIGSFLGDGKENRQITLGFAPSFLILFSWCGASPAIYFAIKGETLFVVEHVEASGLRYVKLNDTGFSMPSLGYTNGLNQLAHYIAFR